MMKLTPEEYSDLLQACANFTNRNLDVMHDHRGVWLNLTAPCNEWAHDRVTLSRNLAAGALAGAAERERLSQEQRCKCSLPMTADVCPAYVNDLRSAVQSHRVRLAQIDAKHGITT